LSKVLGIWVEEIDALYKDQTNTIVMNDGSGRFSCNRLADLLHADTAEVLATYGDDFYRGMPVVTRNTFGEGVAYYLGSDADDSFLDHFYGEIARQYEIIPTFNIPAGVEVTARHKDGQAILFVLNHNAVPAAVDLGNGDFHDLLSGESVGGQFSLEGYDVRILRQ
jgi:beta-galactosidase